ncbi:hypothetical protein F5890DRAFT_1409006 [Lentinula detonsa]|uniref:Hyaluronan/mRNA-binding protein domain-containing protein n=1 Tax=Lentinula detonsa TaxID=2804962 RepID=A0AA38UU09_9AGAR|nr:hypothetical protein F5890DRAFT_1409006 [Lentinula detonsa]
MSVASKNPFAILDEGADNSRPSSPAVAPKAPAPPAPAPARDNKKSTQKGPRGGQYYQRGGAKSSGARGEGNPNQNGVEESESAPKKCKLTPRGRGRGRGGRGRGGGGRGGRPDRHSQTGKTDSDKKIHQGWGGDEGKSELQVENAATVDAAAEQTEGWGAPSGDASGWGATAGDTSAWDAPAGDAAPAAVTEDKPERESRRREEEEEDNTLTLEQYLAQKKEKDASILPDKPQARQANEGADGDIWKDAVAIQKGGDEDAYFVGKKTSAPKARAKKEEKVFIEIDGRFDRPARGGRGRGEGRGEGRGGRGRGEGRRGGGRGGRQNNGPPQTATVNVDDEAAFPSLS